MYGRPRCCKGETDLKWRQSLQSCIRPVRCGTLTAGPDGIRKIVAQRKTGDKADIRYGIMKEGHQSWNNVLMLSKGGRERGVDDLYYQLANVYLSPWFGARTLAGLGFGAQMTGVDAYIASHPDDFSAEERARVLDILERKNARYAVKGNAWQNVFPTHIRDYQDWWARLQAA